MRDGKRRLAVFLSLVIAVTTVWGLIPAEQVQAADVYWYWGGGGYDTYSPMQVKKGTANLYAGDYLSVSCGSNTSYQSYGYLTNLSGVTYKSSNSSVLSVDSKTGKLTAKKAGSATITVKFKGQTHKVYWQVLDKLSGDAKRAYNTKKPAGNKYATAYIKAYGSKLTAKNRYSVLSVHRKAGYFGKGTVSYSTTVTTTENGITTTTMGAPEIVNDAASAHAGALVEAVGRYADKRNPFSTACSKMLNIQKLTGTGQKITATLKNKISADDIFGIQYVTSYDTDIKDASTVQFPIYVMDTTTNHRYYATATLKKNSNTMTIQTKNLKMKKGRTYKLMRYNVLEEYDTWLIRSKVNKFKAK